VREETEENGARVCIYMCVCVCVHEYVRVYVSVCVYVYGVLTNSELSLFFLVHITHITITIYNTDC